MSWRILEHLEGGMMIEHLAVPRFTARWTTGEFPLDAVRESGFFWTDEGSGEEDAIHLYEIVWQKPVLAQDDVAALMETAAEEIERYIMGRA